MENWVWGNYVATFQLLVLFGEVMHEDFYCVRVFSFLFAMCSCPMCFRWLRVYGCVQVTLHTLGVGSVHKIIS